MSKYKGATNKELIEVIEAQDREYKHYIDLSYKAATGKIAKVIRKERGAGKDDPAVEYMTSDEMKAIEKKTEQITTLYELGLDYQQIKSILLDKRLVSPLSVNRINADEIHGA